MPLTYPLALIPSPNKALTPKPTPDSYLTPSQVRNLALKTTVCALTLFRTLGFDESEVIEPVTPTLTLASPKHVRSQPQP